MHDEVPYIPPIVRTPFWVVCQRIAARTLCKTLAEKFEVGMADVWAAFETLTDEQLELLHSPQGWAALADYAASYITGQPTQASYSPTIH